MRFCLSNLLLAGNLLKVLTMINLYHQTNSGFKGEDVGSKIKAVVLLLFIHCLLLLSLFVCFFGHCFVAQYFVSFLVLRSSRWGRES